MKNTFLILIGMLLTQSLMAQQEQVIPPSNGTVTSLEKNVLFYADRRFKVTQSGSVQFPVHYLFDGGMAAVYSTSINPSNPYVLLIENLPDIHTQRASWIGWSTRYYPAKRFKIEAYDQWNHQWVTVVDVNNNVENAYIAKVPSISIGKIRFTVYETNQGQNFLGLSEFFFIHPEAVQAYDNLLVKYNSNGFVGIGTDNPLAKLSVNGNILANEIKIKTNIEVPDYVFDPTYQLPKLSAIEDYVKTHRHLPEIPSAAEIQKDGVDLTQMNLTLLKKVEELTLHAIDNEKKRKELEDKVLQLEKIVLNKK